MDMYIYIYVCIHTRVRVFLCLHFFLLYDVQAGIVISQSTDVGDLYMKLYY